MSEFIAPLAGGILIGVSALLMLAVLGRITGISGILWNGLQTVSAEGIFNWRLCFIVGMVLGPLLAHAFGAPLPAPSDAGPAMAIAAGLLVGFGTHRGSGCTSGHGICGLGRLSVRSLSATLMFMATGIATVFVLRHLIG